MKWFSIFLIALASWMPAGAAHALSWEVACGVDQGAIKRESGGYVFTTSKSYCPGGIFKQRAEIMSDIFSVSKKVTYVFDTTISMTSNSNEQFILFQVADGRQGCSPPLSVRWRENGRLSFDSDYTRGQGMNGCVENRGMRDAAYSGPSLKRDGTAYHLQVQVAFDGAGGFDVIVLIDGATAIGGRYAPPTDAQFVSSPNFSLKHGVYSKQMFDYRMVSAGMKVFTAR